MKILVAPTFETTVKLTTPGVAELAEIRVVWKHKLRDDLKEWATRRLLVNEHGVIGLGVEAEYINEVIASWSGPVDAQGVAVPYSLAALAEVMQNRPTAGQELYKQYLDAETESRLKN